MTPLYGGIEAGGTKWVCAVGTGPDDLRATTRFPTTTPEATLGQAVAFFKGQPPVAAIGIGSFGPIDVHRTSPTFGYITTTPKPGWRDADVAGPIGQALGVPIGFDTDVNTAALGEWRWGAAQGLDTLVYLTVGTGIGGGVIAAGNLLHGLLHPEIGHMRIPRDPARDPFAGSCPYHGDCLEGLAAGPALAARWGERGEQLPPGHPAWELQAHYLALALSNLVCILSPQRIILGGGVMHQPGLIERIRRNVQSLLNGYVQAPQIEQSIDSYIVLPGLGDQAGVLGAIALAEQAASWA
jgi:fructokinase